MLYVYLKKTVRLPVGITITLGAITDLYQSDGSGTNKQEALQFGTVPKEGMILVTTVDVARALGDDTAHIIGADSVAVVAEKPDKKGFVMVLSVAFVALLLFIGGGMTIMNYHSDVDMPNTIKSLSKIFTGSEDFGPWASILYSIGVGLGVLFFSNILPGKKNNPSVFEVEQFALDEENENFERSLQEKNK